MIKKKRTKKQSKLTISTKERNNKATVTSVTDQSAPPEDLEVCAPPLTERVFIMLYVFNSFIKYLIQKINCGPNMVKTESSGYGLQL